MAPSLLAGVVDLNVCHRPLSHLHFMPFGWCSRFVSLNFALLVSEVSSCASVYPSIHIDEM